MPLQTSAFRAARNEKARARLFKALPEDFPPAVLAIALRRPFIPPTPRRAIESYWKHHPLRADALARALAADQGAPAGWTWRVGTKEEGLGWSFRAPPAPYREAAHDRGPGHCKLCGAPVYRLGWHRDLTGEGRVNKVAAWHAACVVAWDLWTQPTDWLTPLKKAQKNRCAATGLRLGKECDVDHRVPLYALWRDRRDLPWPDLLAHWGRPNLQVIARSAHKVKCAAEAGERAAARVGVPGASLLSP